MRAHIRIPALFGDAELEVTCCQSGTIKPGMIISAPFPPFWCHWHMLPKWLRRQIKHQKGHPLHANGVYAISTVCTGSD